MHTEQPDVDGQYVPAEHGVQLDDPGAAKNPIGQMEQEVLVLELLRKEPAGQSKQLFEAASTYNPAMHGLHVDAPTAEAVPEGHCEHDEENAREKVPAAHGMHSDEPDEGAYDPGAQPEQEDD